MFQLLVQISLLTHTFRSILRSQFIRIHRICSDINDYWSHSKRFTNFFKSRGFNRMIIDKISTEISKIPRHDPLKIITLTTFQSTNYYKQKGQPHPICYHMAPKTIWISVNPSPSLSTNDQRLSRIEMCFPAPPILAYRRNRNWGDLLVHNSLTKPTPNTLHLSGYSSPCKCNRHCKLCPSMSNTNSVTNHLTNKTSYTARGKCNTKYTIYAAECTNNNLLYIGQCSQKLNCRS